MKASYGFSPGFKTIPDRSSSLFLASVEYNMLPMIAQFSFLLVVNEWINKSSICNSTTRVLYRHEEFLFSRPAPLGPQATRTPHSRRCEAVYGMTKQPMRRCKASPWRAHAAAVVRGYEVMNTSRRPGSKQTSMSDAALDNAKTHLSTRFINVNVEAYSLIDQSLWGILTRMLGSSLPSEMNSSS